MKRWEHRNIHLLLAPVYVRMIGWCLRHRVSPFGLLKADWALDHGGATFASKYGIQMCFPQDHFPATILLEQRSPLETRAKALQQFVECHGFPVIVKPDLGRIGFGVTALHDQEDAERFLATLRDDYLLQDYVAGPLEFGIFFVRQKGIPDIFGINDKTFPSVVGTGKDTVVELIRQDKRLAQFESLFGTSAFDSVPQPGQSHRLSDIGSHTLGCIFSDVTVLKTPALVEAIHGAVGIPGFNYGRLDVRTNSVEALQSGDFSVIEVNGVESLATNAFDPDYSYWKGLAWFMRQYRLLVEIAAEHRDAKMELLPFREFVRRVREAESSIGRIGSLVHFSDKPSPQ